jgi:hypothetical protein
VTQLGKNRGRRPTRKAERRLFTSTLTLRSRLGCEGSAVQICPSRPKYPESIGYDPENHEGKITPRLWRESCCRNSSSSSANVNTFTTSPSRQCRGTLTISNGFRPESPTEDELKEAVLRMREKGQEKAFSAAPLQLTACDSSDSSKNSCTIRRSEFRRWSNLSTHSGVAGTSTGGTPSSAVAVRPCRANATHLLIPFRYVLNTAAGEFASSRGKYAGGTSPTTIQIHEPIEALVGRTL